MSQDGQDRKAVKTYVPAYQKAIWADHADELDMSQSEFVRTMVQAGRTKFEFSSPESDTGETEDVSERVRSVLRERGPLGWEELMEELTRGLEGDVEDSLEALQASNEVLYSGKRGGYLLTDE
jgi:hypothetical protein